KVLRLKNALYGLKQAPRAWNSRIDKYFQERGFKKCPHEHALYIKMNGKGDILINYRLATADETILPTNDRPTPLNSQAARARQGALSVVPGREPLSVIAGKEAGSLVSHRRQGMRPEGPDLVKTSK
ncbi:hypothetical protein RJ639_012784, partial [Escallonia herrerae]